MASAIKSTTTLATNQSIAPGGTFTSAWVNLTTPLEAMLGATLSWTGSLTTAPTHTVNWSPDGGTTVYQLYSPLTGPTGSGPWNIPELDVPDSALYVQTVTKNNDASVSVSLTESCSHIDSVG